MNQKILGLPKAMQAIVPAQSTVRQRTLPPAHLGAERPFAFA